MPEPLATSKRKFHKLLDSITAASNALPSSHHHSRQNGTPTALHVLTARERFDAASERARKRIRAGAESTELATSLHHQPRTTPSASRPASIYRHDNNNNNNNNSSNTSLSRRTPAAMATSSPGTTDGKKEIPNFSPWSQETFLARLKTFSKVSLWHPKPQSIGEIKWAKRGWQCVDLNTVACKGGCERRVVVKLDTTGRVVKEALKEKEVGEEGGAEDEEELDAAELEEALAKRYEDEIVQGHGDNCMWRKAGCKDDIYRLSLVRPVVWQPELRQRYTSLLTIASSIENVAFRSLPRNDDTALLSPEQLLADLPTTILNPANDTSTNPTPPDNPSHTLREKSLDIALHGWRGASDLGIDLLHCDACFQRIGLWMYQPGYKPGRGILPPEERDPAEMVTVNLLDMHRLHCPWQSGRSQQATGSLAGLNACQILNTVVSGYARDQRCRSDRQASMAGTRGKSGGGDGDGQGVDEEGEEEEDDDGVDVESVKLSPEEIERLDREREGKLRRLKRMFTIKRSSRSMG